jgi:putative copper resistance protein D
VLSGHAATPTDPYHLGALTLLAHVLAAALWIGGLAALTVIALRSTGPLAVALPRFSPVALGCAVTVGVGGVATALLHTGSPGRLVGTGYGWLLLFKIGTLCGLLYLGHLHRRRSLAAPTRQTFALLAAVELVIMAATYGLAVALSQTPPP